MTLLQLKVCVYRKRMSFAFFFSLLIECYVNRAPVSSISGGLLYSKSSVSLFFVSFFSFVDHVIFEKSRSSNAEFVRLNLVEDLGCLPNISDKINQQHFTIMKPSDSLMSDHMNSATSILLMSVMVIEPQAAEHEDCTDIWAGNRGCVILHCTSGGAVSRVGVPFSPLHNK